MTNIDPEELTPEAQEVLTMPNAQFKQLVQKVTQLDAIGNAFGYSDKWQGKLDPVRAAIAARQIVATARGADLAQSS